jgi:hypothetical protein
MLQSQQKSAEESRAGLQRACEQQIEAIRSKYFQQTELYRRYKESLPAALSQTLCGAVLSSLSEWSTTLDPQQKQQNLSQAFRELLVSDVEHVWKTETTEPGVESQAIKAPQAGSRQKLDDERAKLQEQLAAELKRLVQQCVEHAVQQGQATSVPPESLHNGSDNVKHPDENQVNTVSSPRLIVCAWKM